MNVPGFEQISPYYDDIVCPMGFSRSGNFTIKQAGILEQYGRHLLALEKGEMQPENNEQQQFLAVCEGKIPPTTLLEKTWAIYYKLRFNTSAIDPFGKAGLHAETDDEMTDEL